MQIAIRKFTLNEEVDVFDHRETTICRGVLRAFFDLPKDVKVIWVSLHNKSSAMRHEAMISSPPLWPRIQLCMVNDLFQTARIWGYGDIKELFKRLVGKTVYVQVEYEE